VSGERDDGDGQAWGRVGPDRGRYDARETYLPGDVAHALLRCARCGHDHPVVVQWQLATGRWAVIAADAADAFVLLAPGPVS
jgi:hypothetical protein